MMPLQEEGTVIAPLGPVAKLPNLTGTRISWSREENKQTKPLQPQMKKKKIPTRPQN